MSDTDLKSFRDALRSDDTGLAISLFDDFDSALDTQSTRESAVRDAARGIIARVPSDQPIHGAAQQYLLAVSEAQQARLEAKNDFLLYLNNGPSGSDVANKVDDVLRKHNSVQDAEEEIQNTGDEIPLPALVRVFGPNTKQVPKGTTFKITYTVVNVGFESASELVVSSSGYDVSVQPTKIGSLSTADETEIKATGSASTDGSSTLRIQVGSQTIQTKLSILNKVGYLEQAIDHIDELDDSLGTYAEDSEKKRTKGNSPSVSKGLLNKLDTARKRIQEIINNIRNGKQNGIDGKINSVANLLNAFMNQVNGLTPQQITEREAAILRQDADSTIETLQKAIDAEI